MLGGAGTSPVPYAWIALGAKGDGSSTLRTDQDNALVFADGPSGAGRRDSAVLSGPAGRVISGLERVVSAMAKGVHGRQSRWCHPSGLEEYYRHWLAISIIRGRDSSDLYLLRLSSHFRPVRFYDRTRSFISDCLGSGRGFSGTCGDGGPSRDPSRVFQEAGRRKNRRAQESDEPEGERTQHLWWMQSGPSALDQRIFETNTLDRLSPWWKRTVSPRPKPIDLRMPSTHHAGTDPHHVSTINRRGEPDNYINPESSASSSVHAEGGVQDHRPASQTLNT